MGLAQVLLALLCSVLRGMGTLLICPTTLCLSMYIHFLVLFPFILLLLMKLMPRLIPLIVELALLDMMFKCCTCSTIARLCLGKVGELMVTNLVATLLILHLATCRIWILL